MPTYFVESIVIQMNRKSRDLSILELIEAQ
jgi:hypothetical protein